MIAPHGGTLVQRFVTGFEQRELLLYAQTLRSVVVDPMIHSDLELLASGGYSPLEGFLTEEEYRSVLARMHLPNGLPWSIPIVLPLHRKDAIGITGKELALKNEHGDILALIKVSQVFQRDRESEANLVFRTLDPAHPGVRRLMDQPDWLAGGRILYLGNLPKEDPCYFTPRQTRNLFEERGWRSVVAFQTRNPIHRAHEYIQKCALETVDGLFVHPLVGETKEDDVPAQVRMKCYTTLLEKYYPRDRTLLAVFPAAMRYAGPREAIFHAIVRKNYGATHFIVGRDHAGVGQFYGPYDAQKIFSEFDREQIGIVPLFFDYTFFCKSCGQMASEKTCNHTNGSRVSLSGTRIRELLRSGQDLPEEFTRREIAKILREHYQATGGSNVGSR